MILVAIQFLTLLGGLLVNFFVPFYYGLEAYGTFIQANILVFVFQKLTDIVNEPLIGQAEASQIFPLAAALSSLVWIVFVLVDQTLFPLGSPILLASMLASACVSLGLYSLRWHRTLLAYLLLFISLFFVLIGVKEFGIWQLGIVEILIWTNALAILPVVAPLALKVRWQGSGKLLSSALLRAPSNISVTLVFNLFTNLLPYLLSKTLSHAELGLFRVMTSVVQSATSIFPVNTKALFVMFSRSEDGEWLYFSLLRIALAWFAGIAGLALIASMLDARLLPFIALVGVLPILYWGVLSERYLLAQGRRRMLATVNLVIGGAAIVATLWVSTMGQALMLYAVSLSLYAALAAYLNLRGKLRGFVAGLAVITPWVVYVQSFDPFISLIWHLVLFAVSIVLLKMNSNDLRALMVKL